MYVKIKALSVNEAWQGRRFKTKKYKSYAQELSMLLPKTSIPEGNLMVFYEFGVSNMASDWDNMIKAFQDVISSRYGFNDNKIIEGHVRKIKVKKGSEYIAFTIVPERSSQQSFENWYKDFI